MTEKEIDYTQIDYEETTYEAGRNGALFEFGENIFKAGVEYADRHPAKRQTATIDAWVARDKDGRIFIYENKPYREEDLWDGSYYIELPKNDFQEVTFENSPKKVKVTIELEEEV